MKEPTLEEKQREQLEDQLEEKFDEQQLEDQQLEEQDIKLERKQLEKQLKEKLEFQQLQEQRIVVQLKVQPKSQLNVQHDRDLDKHIKVQLKSGNIFNKRKPRKKTHTTTRWRNESTTTTHRTTRKTRILNSRSRMKKMIRQCFDCRLQLASGLQAEIAPLPTLRF